MFSLLAAKRTGTVRRLTAAANAAISCSLFSGKPKVGERGKENLKFKTVRLRALDERLKKSGGTATPSFPHKFTPSLTLAQFASKYDRVVVRNGQVYENDGEVQLCGRVTRVRDFGKKLKFLDLFQGERRVQVKAKKDEFSEEAAFRDAFALLSRGDVVGVGGYPARTDAGELSLLAKQMTVLTPALHMMPSGRLECTEDRYRRRYLDLMMNRQVRNVFRLRSFIMSRIRRFLDERDFLEVETPCLINGTGGASANPFKTHHKELNLDLSLRIAPELHLKMLVIGGFDRVYEMGKQFRNEGIDFSHFPEFTSCEFYMAYADYNDLVTVTENLLSTVANEVLLRGDELAADTDINRDFATAPYHKIDFLPSLEAATGTTFPPPDRLDDNRDFLLDQCCKNHVFTTTATTKHLLDKLFAKLVEPTLRSPTFVFHHPSCMSPLAKDHRSRPGLSERFELYARGLELVDAYTELNDPVKQRERFSEQKTDSYNNALQENFLEALHFGLPPTAGWGIGVDRLVMLMTGQKSIKEVLLFPTLRPCG